MESINKTEGMFIFRDLELNQKMENHRREEEKSLYRYIRNNVENHILSSEKDFGKIVREIQNRINAINSCRIGRGPYLHVDAALPTDHTIGWIKITYLDVKKAQARIEMFNCKGIIGRIEEQ